VFAIRASHAFDGHDFRAGGGAVLVEDGRITGVEPAAYDLPSDCERLDYGDATVLPGLIDTHVHLVADSGVLALDRVAGYSPEEIDTVVTEALRRQLAAGVTTVRDLGDRDFNVVQRRDAQRQVDGALPWIVASGPPITTRGGHCGYLGGEVSGADGIVAAVRERVERRVDVVKVMASGGMNTADTDVFAPQFSIDDLRLLVEQAHAAGLPVTAHAHAALAVDQAVAVDVQGVEHASYLVRLTEGTGPPEVAGLTDIYATGEQLAALADSGIAVCPTLGGFTTAMFACAPPHVKRLLADAGVTLEEVVAKRTSLLRQPLDEDVRRTTCVRCRRGHRTAQGPRKVRRGRDRAW
jgi:imidazolonepropionase-like amidohydrolase